MRFVLLCCLALVAVGAAAPTSKQYCNLCVKLIDELKLHFNNDFKKVTAANLSKAMGDECNVSLSGFEGQICISTFQSKASKILKSLRGGCVSKDCCRANAFCH